MRGQTEKMVTVQQSSLGGMACGFVFVMANSIGLGIWWLWASKETAPTPAVVNATGFINATVVSGNEAWSQWYHVQGIIILVAGLIGAAGVLTQIIIGCNPHVAKAKLYKEAGRIEEAQAEEDEEGAFVKMCMCLHSFISVAQTCLGCFPAVWGCIGLFMFCFGVKLSGATPEKGWNSDSKWYIIISLVTIGTTCCAVCMFAICGLMGAGAGIASLSEDEDEDEEGGE